MNGSALWWPLGGASPQRPVIFFPPSGAEPSMARPLIEHAAGLRFGVVQLPGRGTRTDEPAPRHLRALIAELAGAILALSGPPPVLFGHSFGGLLAYGVTVELEALGVPVGRLITVASMSPPAWAGELERDHARHPDSGSAEFVRRRTAKILSHGGVPAELLAHRDFGARARELVEVDVALSGIGFGTRAVQTPLTAVVARDDRVLAVGAAEGWQEVAAGPYERYDVGGGHFFYRASPQRLVAQLRMELQALDSDYEPA